MKKPRELKEDEYEKMVLEVFREGKKHNLVSTRGRWFDATGLEDEEINQFLKNMGSRVVAPLDEDVMAVMDDTEEKIVMVLRRFYRQEIGLLIAAQELKSLIKQS